MSPPDPARTQRARTLRRDATRAEHALWRGLRGRGLGGAKFRRQRPLGPFPAGPVIVDFVCLERRLVVEVDGGQHALELQGRDDRRRDAWLQANGFRVLRFWNHEVLQNPEGVLQRIEEALAEQA